MSLLCQLLSKRSLRGQCVCNSVNKREFIDERGLPCPRGIKEEFNNHIAIIGLPAHRKHGQAYFESSDFRYAVLSANLLSPESIISGAKNYKIMMYSDLQMLKTGSSNFGQSSGKYWVSPLKAASSLADNTFPEN